MMKIDKLFGDKKSNKVIYILLAMGIMLLVLGSGFKEEPKQEPAPLADSRCAQAERILSEIKGVGEVRVMISEAEGKKESVFSEKKDGDAMPLGSVLIVADGAADSRVREKIILAATAALGVDPHKIQVFERKE